MLMLPFEYRFISKPILEGTRFYKEKIKGKERKGDGTSLGGTRTFDSYFILRYDRVRLCAQRVGPPRWKARETDMDEMHKPRRTTRKRGNVREGRKKQETNGVDIRYDGK